MSCFNGLTQIQEPFLRELFCFQQGNPFFSFEQLTSLCIFVTPLWFSFTKNQIFIFIAHAWYGDCHGSKWFKLERESDPLSRVVQLCRCRLFYKQNFIFFFLLLCKLKFIGYCFSPCLLWLWSFWYLTFTLIFSIKGYNYATCLWKTAHVDVALNKAFNVFIFPFMWFLMQYFIFFFASFYSFVKTIWWLEICVFYTDGDGRFTGTEATKFFAMSNLSRQELKQVSIFFIWLVHWNKVSV